ncbi:mitochondrial coenzyme A diphosphatase NUDT8 isoform X2 [Brachyhypopomus gauderio]|uniref:mitochondrial coenzyme A diphosphatase NUDT8 isoform X2 n=1 Tax=Brachyhypopomus gauderio TaxID=698409 RepID=UPI004041640D
MMFRCPWSVTSACLLGTHKSVITTLGRSQKRPLGGVVSNGLHSQWLHMVSRERGRPQRKPDPHRLTGEARHGSFCCHGNTDIRVNPADVTKQAAGPLTPPKPISSDRFGESTPCIRLPLGQQAEKHGHSARTCKSEQSAGVKNQNYRSPCGVTGKFNGSYMLTRRLWTPCPAGQSHYGLLTARARGVHRRAAQPATLDECLSAQNEARCRGQLRANAALYETVPAKGCAAVLVGLCTVGGEPSLLFTLRSSKLRGRHKGDVSFAGGKRDSSDRNVVDTALREAYEELGVAVTEDEVWGLLKPLRDRSGMLIAPVLANLGPLESLTLRPNPTEVEEIFTLTVAHLCNPQNRGYTHFRTGDHYSYTLPVFHNAKYRIWGLTAIALDQTLKVIMPV